MYKLRIGYKINCSYKRDGKNKPLVKEELQLFVTVRCKELRKAFVVMECADLDKIVNEHILSVYDGKYLNDFFGIATSLDYFARDIATKIEHQLPSRIEIDSVVLKSLDNIEIEYKNESR